MKETKWTRVVSGLLALVFMLGSVPTAVFAAADETGLCAHHEAHTDCGYEADISNCGFVCDICGSDRDESEPEETEPEETEPEESEPEESEPEESEPEESEPEESEPGESEPEETEPVAADPVFQTVTETFVPDVDLPDSEDLFSCFVERELYSYDATTFGTAARANLSATEQAIYDALKNKIEAVAVSGGSTQFVLSGIDGIKTSWTNTELGVSSIEDTTIVESAFSGQFTWQNAATALLADCPFDLYWYDKTVGVKMSYGVRRSGVRNGSQTIWTTAEITDWTFAYPVSSDYASGTNFVTTDVAKVTTAKNKAAQVVAQNAGKSDYEKLVAYKNYICDQVTYNDAAADNDNTPYGDPWQLISVFDSDFTTNVVCEGYSKAFQYLCDLSGLDCISVSGTMSSSTGSGAHMWNVVTLDGSNYLVDVTNTDTGTVGQGGELFLAGGTYKNGGYSFSCGYQTVVFTCSDLGLAATNYTYQPPIATYSVTVADSENGIVTADPTNAAAGTEIQLTVTPDAGYVLDTLTVTWSDDQVIEVTDSKFTMPAGDVTVVAVFKEEPAVVMGTVNADNLNVRSAPSSTADILKRLAINTRIKILELRTVDGVNWGRIAEGWVNLNFVSIDEPNLTGTCGDNLTWKLNTDGVLTISGTGDMYDYSFENTPWYAYREVITGVAIEDGVTKIGNWAFNMCTNLISATIQDGITVIGDDAFSNCNSLTNITIPNSTLSIGNFALHDCISLTDVTIPDSVTTIGSHVFSHCTSLETVIIGSNISSIDSSVFFDCSNLTTIRFCGDMPNLGDNCFSGITATAYYPANRTGWTSDAMLQAGGTITWKSYGASEVAQNGTAKYETLQAAISAASAGDIITLLADIDEIVGINRPLTIMTNGFSLNEDNIFCGKYLNEKGEKVQLTLKEIAGGYVITPMVSSGQEEGDAYAYIDGQESLLPLQTALDEAEKLYKAQTGTKTNVVVKLSGDISINSIVVIPSGVTLNIGTHTLSVRSLIGVEGSYLTATSIANDGTGDYGILKAAKKNVILPEAALVEASTKDYNITVLPVWNPDAAHYEFCRFILWHNATKAMGLEVDEEKEHIKFIFRHQNSTYYQSHLLNKSGTDSGLRVVLEISWKVLDEEGGVLGTPYQTFVYTDKHFTTIAPGGYNYTFNLHGYSAMFLDLDTMLIQTKVISDTGAIAYGKPIDYSFDKLT